MPCSMPAALSVRCIHYLENASRIYFWLRCDVCGGNPECSSAHKYLCLLHQHRSHHSAGDLTDHSFNLLPYSCQDGLQSWVYLGPQRKLSWTQHVNDNRRKELEFKIYEVCLDPVWISHSSCDGYNSDHGNCQDCKKRRRKHPHLRLDLVSYNWLASINCNRNSLLQSRQTVENSRQHKVRIRSRLHQTKIT